MKVICQAVETRQIKVGFPSQNVEAIVAVFMTRGYSKDAGLLGNVGMVVTDPEKYKVGQEYDLQIS